MPGRRVITMELWMMVINPSVGTAVSRAMSVLYRARVDIVRH